MHILSVTHENAFDLAMMVRGEETNPVKSMSLYHCKTFFPLVAIS
jgi:hypothetical protein